MKKGFVEGLMGRRERCGDEIGVYSDGVVYNVVCLVLVEEEEEKQVVKEGEKDDDDDDDDE